MNTFSSSSTWSQSSMLSSWVTKGEKIFNRFKYLITGLAALTAIAIMTTIVTIEVVAKINAAGKQPASNVRRNNSLSPKLNYILNEIASNIDPSVDPCDDFYEYACGSFPKKYPLARGKTDVNYHSIHFDRMYKRIVDRLQGDKFNSKGTIKPLKYLKRIWDTCVTDDSDTDEQMDKLYEYFRELDKVTSVQDKFTKLTKDGYNAFFTVKMNPIKEYSHFVIVGPPELGPLEKAQSKIAPPPLMEFYIDLVKLMKNNTQTRLIGSALDILQVDWFLKSLKSPGSQEQRNPLNSVMNISELNGYTKIKWQKSLNELITNPKVAKFTEATKVIVQNVEYIKRFHESLEEEELNFYLQYSRLMVLRQSCFFLGKKCRDLLFEAIQTTDLISMPKYQDRNHFVQRGCFDFLYQNFEDLMFKVWDSSEVNDPRKFYSGLLVKMAVQMNRTLIDSTWMDEETKVKARKLTRFVAIERNTKSPYYLEADSAIITKYEKAPFIDSSDKVELFDYFRSIIQFVKSEEFAVINRWDRFTFPISFFATRPYLAHEANHFYIPDFFLEGPFSSIELPNQIQYGFFGFLLAHELTHAFDAVAEYYNKFYRSEPFWSSWTKEQFDKKFKCLVDVYSDQDADVYLEGLERQVKINGTSSLNENLADLIGLNVAYEAFKNNDLFNINELANYGNTKSAKSPDPSEFPDLLKDQVDDRLFFLAFANVHCGNRMRPIVADKKRIKPPLNETTPKFIVNIPLAQFDKFGQAFECEPGSRMNPEKKCPFK